MGLGDEKNFLSVFRIFADISADSLFAFATHIGSGGIPVGYPEFKGLMQYELVELQTSTKR